MVEKRIYIDIKTKNQIRLTKSQAAKYPERYVIKDFDYTQIVIEDEIVKKIDEIIIEQEPVVEILEKKKKGRKHKNVTN